MLQRHSHVLTVGHSDHDIESFVRLLYGAGVTAIADVRSTPYSGRHPHFNREELAAALRANDIAYVFLGEELGARPKDRTCWCGGKVSFGRLSRHPRFVAGLKRVERGTPGFRIALMCSERDPATCHRTILVAPELERMGLTMSHLMADGSVRSQREVMLGLATTLRVPKADMFRCEDDVIADAYTAQAERIAYREDA